MSSDIRKMMEEYMRRERLIKIERYRQLNKYAQRGKIVFAGSSLAEQFPINELSLSLSEENIIYNRGIGGDTTNDMLSGDSMDVCIFELEPEKIFINIGSNDIGAEGYSQDQLLKNYEIILERIKEKLPGTKVFILSYYPVNPDAAVGLPENEKNRMFSTRTNEAIKSVNRAVNKLADSFKYIYIDVSTVLCDGKGVLKSSYTIEGIHLWPKAYSEVLEILKDYFK